MYCDEIAIENRISNSILAWVPMKRGASVLCVNLNPPADTLSNMCGVKTEYIHEGQLEQIVSLGNKFDYIFAFEVLEKATDPVLLLESLKRLLKPEGVLYLGTDNRLGLRYFCGDIDPFTEKAFVAVEDYNYIDNNELTGRLYSRDEIEKILSQAGLHNIKFYSVLPHLAAAQLIYADGYLPPERLATRLMPMYRDPSSIFIREEWVYDSIIANGMFHKMANSYLIEISPADTMPLNNILQVTLSADRGEENSCVTVIYSSKVEKKAMYTKGQQRLVKLKENDDDLLRHGVPMVESEIKAGVYVMPCINGVVLERYLQNMLRIDRDKFLQILDRYRDVIYSSSDIVCVDEHGPILKRCYIDLVPLNCFYQDDKFLFYDQEFYLENEAANLIMWRALVIIYDGNPTLNAIIPISELMNRYGITKFAEEYSIKSGEFMSSLHNQEELSGFNSRNLRDINRVMENRRKVEYALIDWETKREKLTETCFDGLSGMEIFVFGSGRYADEFICMYRYDYQISGIIDNNIEKQGSNFYGYEISSPDLLRGKRPDEYKVIICVKNCSDILKQLYEMGVKNIGIYNIHHFYQGRQKTLPGQDGLAPYQEFYVAPTATDGGLVKKKYHIGYIAGVFDLFHLGHLNMFRRAKEMCEYLIVGVVSDEGVRENKKTEPVITFEERIEIVRSCKYVDEAVEIPFVYCRTPEAFRKYHFDVQFSGSDYENDPGWLSMKAYLEEHGAALVFFPYTQQTSSTKIKALIDSKLAHNFVQEAGNDKVTLDLLEGRGDKIYKKGYCMLTPYTVEPHHFLWLKKFVEQCEEFILGIPEEWTMARIFGDGFVYNVSQTKDILENLGWFSEVRVLEPEYFDYKKIYEDIKFDVCFYGMEYGCRYEADKRFMKEHNVRFIPVIPERYTHVNGGGALRFALDNLTRNQKIILFGTGRYFDIYMNEYGRMRSKYMPAYAVDNDSSKWESTKLGVKIYSPTVLSEESPDNVLIIICSKNYQEMLTQLKEIKDFDYRIMIFNNDVALLEEFGISAELEKKYLKDSHRVLTVLMEEFDRVCIENNLHYYMICGSLIGAVRHKGMIPWDDDIDVAMPREDYKKLKKIAKKIWNKKNDTFRFLDYKDIGGGAFLDCMPRLFYMKEQMPTKCFDKVMGKATADIEDRMFIDIYVMDRAHINGNIHNFCTNIAMKGIYNLMMGHRAFVDYDEYRGVIDDKTIDIMKKVHRLGKMLPIGFLAFWYDVFSRSGNFRKHAPDVIMASCAIRCVELKYPIEHFGEGMRVPFETIEVMIPSDYNAQLQDMRYKNYMEFPRMSLRKPSHYFNSDIEIW